MHTNSSNSQSWPRQPPPTNQRQPLHPPQFVDPFVMQQLSESQANTTPRCDGSTPMHHFYGSPIRDGLTYQGMAQQYQYRAPTSGPSHNQHSKGFHKAEAHYNDQYNMYHADHSTGIHPVDARTGGSYNTGSGEAWRPPSRNPSMADYNSTQQMQKTRYNRDRASRTRRSRTDNVDVSVYEIPMESKSMLISISIMSLTTLSWGRDDRWFRHSSTDTANRGVDMGTCPFAIDINTCICSIDIGLSRDQRTKSYM